MITDSLNIPGRIITNQPRKDEMVVNPFFDPNHNHLVNSSTHLHGETTPLIFSPYSHPGIKSKRTYSQHFNDTLSKWTREIYTFPSQLFGSQLGIPKVTEIHYSVFRPPPDVTPIKNLPPCGYVNTGPITKEQFQNIVEDCKLAIEVDDIKPIMITTGSSGSYFIFNRDNQIVGVFKPQDEEPYGPLSPKLTKWIHRNFFPCFFGRSCLIPNTAYIAESSASLMDRQLQTFIVPFTDTIELSSDSFYYPTWERITNLIQGHKKPKTKIGSFQLFINGYMGADDFFQKYPLPNDSSWVDSQCLTNNNNNLEFSWTQDALISLREQLEKLVILDFIMRNTDRGLDNWMLKIENDESISGGKPRIKLGAIDNGLSFPWKHPNEWRSFPFGWLFLPISIIGQPFSEKTRRHFISLLTSTIWWEDTTILLREMFSRDPGYKERMFKKQISVMKGQAFVIVETLKNSDEGPIDLARKTRMLVHDEEVEVPFKNPISQVLAAMETPMHKDQQLSGSHNKFQSISENNELNLISPASEPLQRMLTESAISIGSEISPMPNSEQGNLQDNWNQLITGKINDSKFDRNNSQLVISRIPSSTQPTVISKQNNQSYSLLDPQLRSGSLRMTKSMDPNSFNEGTKPTLDKPERKKSHINPNVNNHNIINYNYTHPLTSPSYEALSNNGLVSSSSSALSRTPLSSPISSSSPLQLKSNINLPPENRIASGVGIINSPSPIADIESSLTCKINTGTGRNCLPHDNGAVLRKEQIQEQGTIESNLDNGINLISPGSKIVIIERLETVSGKPPVFTQC